MMAGLHIKKMELFTPLMQQSACFPQVTFPKNGEWLIWTVGMRLLWIYLQELDTSHFRFLWGKS